MLRGTVAIVTTLVLLSAGSALAPSAGATKPCPVKYCTTPTGEYLLEVQPLTSNPLLAEYAVCTWNVHVDFGDGTEQDYVFDASIGLTGSHVFPTPGTYAVEFALHDGHPSQVGAACPDFGQVAKVLYRTVAEEADDPPKDPSPWVPIDNGPLTPAPIAVVADSATPTPTQATFAVTGAPPVSDPTAYWRHCRAAVLTHLVACARGRRVARGALAKLTLPGSARVGGFSCRLPRGDVQAIACARGEQRVLVPVA